MRFYLLAVLLMALTASASAQTIVVKPNDRPTYSAATEPACVNVAVNIMISTSGDADQALKAQEDAWRRVCETR